MITFETWLVWKGMHGNAFSLAQKHRGDGELVSGNRALPLSHLEMRKDLRILFSKATKQLCSDLRWIYSSDIF